MLTITRHNEFQLEILIKTFLLKFPRFSFCHSHRPHFLPRVVVKKRDAQWPDVLMTSQHSLTAKARENAPQTSGKIKAITTQYLGLLNADSGLLGYACFDRFLCRRPNMLRAHLSYGCYPFVAKPNC